MTAGAVPAPTPSGHLPAVDRLVPVREPWSRGDTITIERLDGGQLELDGWGLASAFFATDPGSVGADSYDSLCGRTSPDRIETSDVQALNRTARARTAHDRWASVLNRRLSWLSDIDPALDLIETDDAAWAALDGDRLVSAALTAVVGPGLGVSVATKMLHLKRPRLFPILDRLVVEMLGGSLAQDAPPAARAQLGVSHILHVRSEGARNIAPLSKVQSELARLGLDRSLVRILDAILWLSHPAAGNSGPRRVLACRMEGVVPPGEAQE